MKLSKLLLMGLLASGLMLSACNTKDNSSGNNTGSDSGSQGGEGQTAITLEGNRFLFKDIVEKDDNYDFVKLMFNSYCVEFKKGSLIEFYLADDLTSDSSPLYSGTYNQNGNNFTYSFTKNNGADISNDSYREAWSNLPGSIDGNDITMKMYIDTDYYLNIVFSLEQWTTIDYATFKAAYDSKENAPWNHLYAFYGDEMTQNEDGSLVMFRLVENLIDGKWVVDESLTENGGGDLTPNLIPNNEIIEQYGNPPVGYEITFKKNGEQHQMLVHATQDGRTVEIVEKFDKYFYVTDHVQTVDGRKVIECHASWSIAANPVSPIITLKGNKFVFKSKVEESIKIGDETIITMPADYIEFKEGGLVEAVVSSTEPEVRTTIAKGTYIQNGSKFTYSFTGVEYNGTFTEYPDEMKEAYANLEGTIDGNDITMTFSVMREGTVVYYHEIYTLDK